MVEQVMMVEFIDSGREPQCAPHPAYPDGLDIDASNGAEATCTVNIPYPAPRCGVMIVKCAKCGLHIGLTVAGRPDDPKSVKLGCLQTRH